jgi:hypothetical protein
MVALAYQVERTRDRKNSEAAEKSGGLPKQDAVLRTQLALRPRKLNLTLALFHKNAATQFGAAAAATTQRRLLG